jgi:hypothetical protein
MHDLARKIVSLLDDTDHWKRMSTDEPYHFYHFLKHKIQKQIMSGQKLLFLGGVLFPFIITEHNNNTVVPINNLYPSRLCVDYETSDGRIVVLCFKDQKHVDIFNRILKELDIKLKYLPEYGGTFMSWEHWSQKELKK